METTIEIEHTPDSYILTKTHDISLQGLLQFFADHVKPGQFLSTANEATRHATNVFLACTQDKTDLSRPDQ